ncbi:hypothetical protein K3495_g15436 [Podosphaera aphanis]|nr:hypothetical protein K3495_g15436 [Podosphaera aphanis]
MDKSIPKSLPLPAGTVFKSSTENDPWYILEDEDASLYRQIVSSVLYLSNGTRPDISYAVGRLARFMSSPNSNHLSMAKHLLRYLKGNRSLGIMYKATNDTKDCSAWTDATWGTEDDRKSFQGQTIIWKGGAVTWSATRQKSTAQSSMEAEIMPASEGAKEIAWMEKIASDIGITLKSPPLLHIDNKSAIELTRTTKLY